MNNPLDPNVTTDLPSAAADAAGASDALPTTDDVRGSASTDGSHARVDAPTNDLPAVPGYRVLREIARGGMGRVLAAYDLTLDRDVALKVLLPGAPADRFVRESKITARLPHPGIPPVHALGTLADGSPFLAMKLIAGRTLAALFPSSAWDRGGADRPRLLQAFLQVCQAVGFAHSRGIVHRDLKPTNVMVGAFGEVQVMDWGLAKDMTGWGAVDEAQPSQPTPTDAEDADPGATKDYRVAATFPNSTWERSDERTEAGTVLGTPAYMAPEQARGEATDARADVFALGGILCAILTGQPLYSGKSTMEVLQRAEAADLAEAHARLDGCGADAELVALCRRCLSPSPADRPADAQAVADGMTAYLAGVQEKLRISELAQAEANAKTREEAKRRRVTRALAGVVLAVLLVGLGGTSWGFIQAKKQEGIATLNADAAIALVRDLSSYVEYYEMGSGKSAATEEERKERLDTALASYARLLELNPNDKFVRWHFARMHRFRANLSRFLDQTEEAEKSYQMSLKLFRGLSADFPDELKYRELHALVKRDYAGQLGKLGRYKEASRLVDEAIELYEELLRGQPDESNFQRNLAHMLLIRSDFYFHVGRLADSERAARRSVELHAKVAKVTGIQQPLDPLFHAMAELNLAVALREQDRLQDADAAHKSSVQRMMSLINVHNTRDTRSFYAEVRAQRAVTQARLPGGLLGPIADLRGARQGWDLLIKQMGPNPVDLNRKAVASLYSARLHVRDGKRGDAVKDLETAAMILEDLVKKAPEIPRYRYDLGRTYTTLGQIADDGQQANDWYRKARDMLDGAIARFPENVHYRKALAELNALAPIQAPG